MTWKLLTSLLQPFLTDSIPDLSTTCWNLCGLLGCRFYGAYLKGHWQWHPHYDVYDAHSFVPLEWHSVGLAATAGTAGMDQIKLVVAEGL
jgi:hypothetical protein